MHPRRYQRVKERKEAEVAVLKEVRAEIVFNGIAEFGDATTDDVITRDELIEAPAPACV